ncbi:MAG: hypothetical protein HUJ68_07610 [Clostridia bacterium]|nr:hypothetical protein [Clostridia bacterium]
MTEEQIGMMADGNSIEEAFENMALSSEELEKFAQYKSSLDKIGKIVAKAKTLTDEEKKFYEKIKSTYKEPSPIVQLNKIKGFMKNVPDAKASKKEVETVANIMLEEVISQVPEKMTYSEFIKEYDIIAVPKKGGFFKKLFLRRK